jgi:hypothetical protein
VGNKNGLEKGKLNSNWNVKGKKKICVQGSKLNKNLNMKEMKTNQHTGKTTRWTWLASYDIGMSCACTLSWSFVFE